MYDIAKARQAVDAPDQLRAIAKEVRKQGNEALADALTREAIYIEFDYDRANNN